MSQKISLMAMAEAVGDRAATARHHLDRYNRDHPGEPLQFDHWWEVEARTFAAAHLTLSLMALDEEASRKFVASLMGSTEAKLLVAMLMPAKPKAVDEKAEAA